MTLQKNFNVQIHYLFQKMTWESSYCENSTTIRKENIKREHQLYVFQIVISNDFVYSRKYTCVIYQQ